ncbi:threonine synthase [Microbacterium sorbitolivorans]|uniref:Threonine synthase n=1 Tax=Microbacterium sorbitolivorans TaxID=1867410 RepID=A0A367XY97_9MICO|nr:threonine synthase [Microbacterium sorbitolivorans]RCK58597.1 threonine synthase [Microbacterium sorbitolivorans]GGF37809.1 threonine synthase [Microbacterium sorbitolivorans]
MQYISTRGGMEPTEFCETLLEGLAPDGGLAIPTQLPSVDASTLEAWRGLDYADLATEVIGLFATDIPRDDLSAMTHAAYSADKFPGGIVPLRDIDGGITLVGLSEGPTLAFKDMAMQFLGQVMEYALERRGTTLNIVGATSGDTGSAAEQAFRGKKHINVFMLSPQGRMSGFQRAQMFSLQDENIHNIAVEGVFDDAQNLVKALSGDLEFKRAHNLGAVNSINLARIVAQVVYYFWAWLRATDNRGVLEVSVAVPSGNFGNILAGYFAKSMGLPIRKLVLAANENNVLDEFFRTGLYRPRSSEQTLATSSPSMDISKASNLERFLFDLLGRDAARMNAAWAELDANGVLDLTAELPRLTGEFGFGSGTSTHADRLATIKAVYKATGEIIDPHTADGVKVARDYVEEGVPMLVMETAKPAKFQETITEAIGVEIELNDELRAMLDAPQRVVEMPSDEQLLRYYVSKHAAL